MIRARLLISILFLSLLSSPSSCRLLANTAGKIFSAPLVLHTRDHTDDNNEVEVEDHGNRRCFKKVMMVEQLEYQDVETCNHSYDKVCLSFCVTHSVDTFSAVCSFIKLRSVVSDSEVLSMTLIINKI